MNPHNDTTEPMTIDEVILDRLKVIGDDEWTLLGTPAEFIATINALIEQEKRAAYEAGVKAGDRAFELYQESQRISQLKKGTQ